MPLKRYRLTAEQVRLGDVIDLTHADGRREIHTVVGLTRVRLSGATLTVQGGGAGVTVNVPGLDSVVLITRTDAGPGQLAYRPDAVVFVERPTEGDP